MTSTQHSPIDPAELRERLGTEHPPRLLDVRTPAEFAAVHIPGSHNVPLDDVRAHRTRLADRLAGGPPTVLICRSGQRAGQAERELAGAGLTDLRVLAGGLAGWESAEAPVSRGRNRWDMDRQVRFTAGCLVLLGVLGSLVVPGLQWFAGLIGFALAFTALLGICPMALMLGKMPWNRSADYDLDTALSGLSASAH